MKISRISTQAIATPQKKNTKANLSTSPISQTNTQKLDNERIRNHYAANNQINFSGGSRRHILDTFLSEIFEGKHDTSSEKFLKKTYKIMAEFVGIKNPDENCIKLTQIPQRTPNNATKGTSDELTGAIDIDEFHWKLATDYQKLKTVGHEVEHQRQDLIAYRFLGEKEYIKMLTNQRLDTLPNEVTVAKNNNKLYLNKKCPKDRKIIKKEVHSIVSRAIKENQILQKNKKAPLTPREKKEAPKIVHEIRNYYKTDYEKSELENEAFGLEAYIENEYDNWGNLYLMSV